MKKKVGLLISFAAAFSMALFAAACGETDFIVSFDTGFGSSIPAQRVTDGFVIEPSVPTREGYIFRGWFKDKNFSEPFSFDEAVESDVTIYAKWERGNSAQQKYKVYFHENGGTEVSEEEVTAGEGILEPSAPTREGYEFAGWYIDDALEIRYAFGTPVTHELHLFAKWETASAVREENGLLYRSVEGAFYVVSAKDGYAFEENVSIPAEFEGLPVTVIGSMHALTARKVTIAGDMIVSTGAFAGNESVESVEFSGSPIIGDRAFYNSALRAVVFGGAVSIGESAFEQTNLVTVTIPATVSRIGSRAFAGIETLEEVGFAGELPAFSAGTFGTDPLDYYISQSALDKLVGDVSEEQKQDAIEKALSDLEMKGRLYSLGDEELKESLSAEGFYRGDADIYIGMGTHAVIFTAEGTSSSELYSYESVFAFREDGSRDVYKLDEKKSNKLLHANDRGEVLDGDTLYDYVGNTLVYHVPETISYIAPGAGVNNSALRILSFGDSTREIGSFAFSYGYLIGVSFGSGLEKIGEYAFFGQNMLLTEVVFRSDNIPEIGEGAFCYFSGTMILSSVLSGDMALRYGQPVYIWTPLASYESDGYVSAFNASVETFVYENEEGKPVTQTYSLINFRQIKDSGAFAKGERYTTACGVIEMTGTESGYVLAYSYDGEGNLVKEGYAYLSVLPGYSGDNAARHFTFYWEWDPSSGMVSEDLYGTLDAENKTVISRGAEAGTYGDVNKTVLRLDGYGLLSCDLNGATYFGSYTLQGNTLTITGIEGLASAVLDFTARTVTLNGETLRTIGDEAGTYRDIANRAILILDGIPYEESVAGENETTTYHYNGKLKLTYNGVTTETGYFLTGTKFEFALNDEIKDWTYSRVAESPLSGYYGDYTDMLSFKFEQAKGASEYTRGGETLVLDGYYGATIGDKSYSYLAFEDPSSVLLISSEGAVSVVKLHEDDMTFVFVESKEAGMYYVGSGANYRLYLDGNGQLIYFDGENKFGSYEYDVESNALHTDIGELTEEGLEGVLDLGRGVGYFVYNYYGATYVALSTTPFMSEKLYANALVYSLNGEEAESESLSFTVSRTAGYVFVNISGQPFAISELQKFEPGDAIELVCKKNEASYSVSFTKTESEVYATVKHNDRDEIFETDNGIYQFVWLDEEKSVVAITKLMQYPVTILAGKVEWSDGAHTSFSYVNLDMESGEYKEVKVHGYGSDDVTLNIRNSGAAWYDSFSGAEYKYYKINVYSENELWVSNENVGGNSKPEVAEYTKEVVDGTTYYTFTSAATGKVVRFHFEGTSFVVDSETDPA